MSLLFVNGVSKSFIADPNHVCALGDCVLPIFLFLVVRMQNSLRYMHTTWMYFMKINF